MFGSNHKMKNIFFWSMLSLSTFAQNQHILSNEMALNLAELSLHCVHTEYPNKTGHTFNTEAEVGLSPIDLHPTFYGCYDWQSSVHGHWMLVRLLKTYPNLSIKQEIIQKLNQSLTKENLLEEALYFSKYPSAKTFERTYSWAWLLKLDEEISVLARTEQHEYAKKWKENLQPLTNEIVKNGKTIYLNKPIPTELEYTPIQHLDWHLQSIGQEKFKM